MNEKEVSLDSIMPRDCQPKAKRIVGVVNEQKTAFGLSVATIDYIYWVRDRYIVVFAVLG